MTWLNNYPREKKKEEKEREKGMRIMREGGNEKEGNGKRREEEPCYSVIKLTDRWGRLAVANHSSWILDGDPLKSHLSG